MEEVQIARNALRIPELLAEVLAGGRIVVWSRSQWSSLSSSIVEVLVVNGQLISAIELLRYPVRGCGSATTETVG